VEFRILGPLEVAGDAGPLHLAGGKQKALLALLLLHADRVVPMTGLVDDLWGEDVPGSAQKMVQIFVSQLRKQLPEGLLRTRPPGYALDLSGHSLDLRRFAELAERGRAALADARAADAAELLADALGLWRGPPLAEFAEPFARTESARLEEQQLACLEDRIDADLALGRHAALVPELDSLVIRHPHRERLRSQLMLALYRSGRHAEALAAYQSFRRLLAEELGIDPSGRLKELERRMLRQDPDLELAEAAPVLPAPTRAPEAAERGAATVCPACGAPAPASSRFCASCGTPLGEDRPDEMLKLVTVLFADVVGSTARAEALHPEDVRSLMRNWFEAMAQELHAEGATIERFAGDEIMAVFGVPTAREDDAVRAVRAARRMLERLTAWNVGRDPDRRLEIRIGVNTGEVIAAGEPGAHPLVVGDAVNVAARLRQAADAGMILVGGRTARASRSHFVFRELAAPLALKGKSAAVEALLVVGERETAEPRGEHGLVAPLVGREHQLGFLRTAHERVQAEQRPELVTLVGDAGIGKSRLAAEFTSALAAEAQVLIGRCLQSGQAGALAPLAEMLNALGGVFETDSSETAHAKIAHLVRAVVDADLSADRARTQAALESTLGLTPDDDSVGVLDPHDRFQELIAAWRALLASLARRGPVVAVVEDIHWADATLLEILDELADGLDGQVFFLCTARPDLLRLRPDWGGGRRSFSSLPLDPLSPDESDRLISLLLDADSVTEVARRRILACSEGNPFFLEEILRHLIDEGLLLRDDGRWRATRPIDAIELPDSVQAVILARLDLLAPEERRVAQRAAVVGRRFWDGAVSAVAGLENLDGVLRTLRRREFVVERLSSSIAGEREFAFKHVLIRDVAYESLPRAERGRAHADTAAWMERTLDLHSGGRAEMLAHHYDAAYSYLGTEELRGRARANLLLAAADAHRRYAIGEGDRLAQRAVELSTTGPERLEALEALGDLHYLKGDDAWRAYGEALAELAEDDPAYARIAAKAAEFACRWVGTMQQLPEVEDVRRVIEAGLGSALPSSHERAMLLVLRGWLAVQREGIRGHAARAAVEEALAAAEALDDPDLLSAALDLSEAEHMHVGRYGEMYGSALRRAELIPRLRDAREAGDANAMAAWSANHSGRYRAAEQYATACLESGRGRDAGWYLHGLTWRVMARFMLGDWDGALSDQAEIERVAAPDGTEAPRPFTMTAYTCTALCRELLGDDEGARRYVDLSLRFFAQRPELPSGPSCHPPPLALALAHQGRYEEEIGVAPLVPRTGSAGLTFAVRCEIAAARGDWGEVPVLAAAAREEAEYGGLLALPPVVDRLEGRAAAAAGDDERAAVLLRRSADGFGGLEAPWEEAWSRLLLGEVLLPSDRGAAELELSAALATFDRLRSVRESERTRSALAGVVA
jgi:class 3 adenylate cyclase/DNA-binding SARP family transcriptional activator